MDRTDGAGTCSITVHLRQTQQVSGSGVLFEACRVGSVDVSDGSMTLNWDLGELNSQRPSVPTEHVTSRLSEILFQIKESDGSVGAEADGVEIRTAVTGADIFGS